MEHAVIAHLPLLEDPFGSEREREIIADLAGELQHAIDGRNVGEFDGEEFNYGVNYGVNYGEINYGDSLLKITVTAY